MDLLDIVSLFFYAQYLANTRFRWGLWCLTCGSYIMQFFALWLKAEKTYSVPQINNIPTVCLILGPSKYWRNAYCYEVKLMLFMLTGAFQIIGAVNFFFMIGTGFVSDKLGNRGPVCLVVGALLTFCYIVLTVWDVPSGLKMAAFCLAGCYGCFSPLMAGVSIPFIRNLCPFSLPSIISVFLYFQSSF